jgi:hypothetical protein
VTIDKPLVFNNLLFLNQNQFFVTNDSQNGVYKFKITDKNEESTKKKVKSNSNKLFELFLI